MQSVVYHFVANSFLFQTHWEDFYLIFILFILPVQGATAANSENSRLWHLKV